MYNIAFAVEKDIPFIADVIGKEMSSLIGNSSLYDEEQMSKVLKNIMAHKGIVIVTHNDVIVGALGCMIAPYTWNPTVNVLLEMFWWVKEEYRATRVGSMLLFHFEKYGKALGVKQLIMSVLPSTKANLTKRGYVVKELSLVKEI